MIKVARHKTKDIVLKREKLFSHVNLYVVYITTKVGTFISSL